MGNRRGGLEVICGPMFSGKTDELIRRLRRELVARRRVQVFKPEMDNRYSADEIVSHDSVRMPADAVREWSDVLARLHADTDVVGIDEANLLGPGLLEVAETAARRGLRVIVSGLDMDHLGRPFPPIPELLAIADHVVKNAAVCTQCGSAAIHTQRVAVEDRLIVVGAADLYEARCRRCFKPRASASHSGMRTKLVAAAAAASE